MEKKLFRQSALIISVIISVLFALSRWDPLFYTVGLARSCMSFGKALGLVWLAFALFRNVKIPRWLRYVLLVFPLYRLLLSFDCFNFLWGFHSGRPDVPIFAFAIFCLIPIVGIKPSCGKSLRSNVIVFAASMTAWLALGFFSGYQANAHGFGFYFFQHTLAIFAYYICEGLACWSLIALSLREEINPAYNHTWVKITSVLVCVVATYFVFCWKGFALYNRIVNHIQYGWAYLHLFTPIVWYVSYCGLRVFRAIFSKDHPWRSIFFDRLED